MWDERALDAVAEKAGGHTEIGGVSVQVRAFMPSLYLSLADDHRRLGSPGRAQQFLARAESASDALGDDTYGDMIRNVMEGVRTALAAGSTQRLSAP